MRRALLAAAVLWTGTAHAADCFSMRTTPVPSPIVKALAKPKARPIGKPVKRHHIRRVPAAPATSMERYDCPQPVPPVLAVVPPVEAPLRGGGCTPPPGITGPWPCTMTPQDRVVLEDRLKQRIVETNQVPEPGSLLLVSVALGVMSVKRWAR